MEEQPVVSSGFSVNKKTILSIVGLVVLVAAVPLAVYLTQQKQIFKPKASETVPVSGPETSLTLVSQGNNFPVGSTFRVSVWVRSDIDAANLFVSKIKFPSALLEVVNIIAPGGSSSCKPRPACLDTTPACKMPEPTGGWCGQPEQSPDVERSRYFIKNWTEKYFDNRTGIVSLVGEVPSPGWQSRVGQPGGLMADLVFRAQTTGSATISFDAGSAIYRNSDNRNILGIKRDLTLNLGTPVMTRPPIPTPTSGPLTPTPTLSPLSGDVNGDGRIDLTDLSILLTRWGMTGNEAGRADLNWDGVVNSVDRSLLINILVSEGIIRQT